MHKSKAINIEFQFKDRVGYCWWREAELARLQGDRKKEKENLQQALATFTKLKMPRERDEGQAALDKLDGGGAAVSN